MAETERRVDVARNELVPRLDEHVTVAIHAIRIARVRAISNRAETGENGANDGRFEGRQKSRDLRFRAPVHFGDGLFVRIVAAVARAERNARRLSVGRARTRAGIRARRLVRCPRCSSASPS